MIRSKHAATRRPLLRVVAAWCGLIGAVWTAPPAQAEAAAERAALAARVQLVRAALSQAQADAEPAVGDTPADPAAEPHAAGRPWLNWSNWNNWNNWPNWGNWGNWLNR